MDTLAGAGVTGLVTVVQQLSMARDVASVQAIVRTAARRLTGADGATFVLRDDGCCYYADEDAIAPLWKGQRFPLEACISGWSMLNRAPAVIEDIYADERIPHDAYRPTFVRSLAMVPIRSADPIGAIGNYWATRHRPTDDEVELLQALADSTAVALENVRVLSELEEHVAERTAALRERTAEAESLAARLAQEVQERRRAEDEVRQLSLTDELTGVPNRRGFIERAEQARKIARRAGRSSVLLFVDVDGLKDVNDRLGHGAGDRLIREAATILADTLREGDAFGRWGGDEFVAFLPGVDDPQAVCRRVLDRVEAGGGATGPRLRLSVGALRATPGDVRPLEHLLAEADAEMYAAKRRRRVSRR